MFRPLFSLLLGLCALLPLAAQNEPWAAPADTFEQTICARLDHLMTDELLRTTQVGLYVYDLTAQRPLYDRGRQQRMRPASTQKVLTSIIALDLLRGDYRLTTQLYITAAPTDSVLRGDVVLRGAFDPLLGRDDLRALLAQLKSSGVWSIEGDVCLDASMTDGAPMGWGWCWDDKEPPLTALTFRHKEGISSALLRILEQEGIRFSGALREGTVPTTARLIASRGHAMEQVMVPMMKHSDNHYAESLFYHLAATFRPRGASHKDGRQVCERWMERLRLPKSHYQVADGSGLSLYNYLTPEVLVAALRYAAEREEILNQLLPTLPIMGRDGTLKQRGRGTAAQDRVQAKTGTVEGVSSLAGYALAPNGHRLAFAMINQGVPSSRQARQWQDKVCVALTAGLGGNHIEPDTLSTPAPQEDDEASESDV